MNARSGAGRIPPARTAGQAVPVPPPCTLSAGAAHPPSPPAGSVRAAGCVPPTDAIVCGRLSHGTSIGPGRATEEWRDERHHGDTGTRPPPGGFPAVPSRLRLHDLARADGRVPRSGGAARTARHRRRSSCRDRDVEPPRASGPGSSTPCSAPGSTASSRRFPARARMRPRSRSMTKAARSTNRRKCPTSASRASPRRRRRCSGTVGFGPMPESSACAASRARRRNAFRAVAACAASERAGARPSICLAPSAPRCDREATHPPSTSDSPADRRLGLDEGTHGDGVAVRPCALPRGRAHGILHVRYPAHPDHRCAAAAQPRGCARGAATVVLSDALERGGPDTMTSAIARLSRLAWRVSRLTPLAADPAFRPETAALAAIAPFLDDLGDGASLDALCRHMLSLGRVRGRASDSRSQSFMGRPR